MFLMEQLQGRDFLGESRRASRARRLPSRRTGTAPVRSTTTALAVLSRIVLRDIATRVRRAAATT